MLGRGAFLRRERRCHPATTFLAALRHDRIDAPCVIDGPINGETFLGYVEQFLVPTLSPGDIVVLDNLGSHKSDAVRAAIKAAGAHRLFLPAYSPDLNPIEQVFAKLKHLLRKARERTVENLWDRIGELLYHAAAAGTGKSNREIAELFGVSPSAVSKWSQRYRSTGSADAGQMGGHRRAILTDEREWLQARVGEPDSDVTIRGLQAELEDRGIAVSYGALRNFLHREGLSYKKNRVRKRAGSTRHRPQAHPLENASSED